MKEVEKNDAVEEKVIDTPNTAATYTVKDLHEQVDRILNLRLSIDNIHQVKIADMTVPMEDWFNREIRSEIEDFEELKKLFRVEEIYGQEMTIFDYTSIDTDNFAILTDTMVMLKAFERKILQLNSGIRSEHEMRELEAGRRKVINELSKLLNLKIRMNETDVEKTPLREISEGIRKFTYSILPGEIAVKYDKITALYKRDDKTSNNVLMIKDVEEMSGRDLETVLMSIPDFAKSLIEFPGKPLEIEGEVINNGLKNNNVDLLLLYCMSQRKINPFIFKALGVTLTREQIILLILCGKIKPMHAPIVPRKESSENELPFDNIVSNMDHFFDDSFNELTMNFDIFNENGFASYFRPSVFGKGRIFSTIFFK